MVSNLAVDNTLGNQVVPDCPSCCGYNIPSITFAPDPVNIVIDGTENLAVNAFNACSGILTDISLDFTYWASNNSSIAAVTKGKVQGVRRPSERVPNQQCHNCCGWDFSRRALWSVHADSDQFLRADRHAAHNHDHAGWIGSRSSHSNVHSHGSRLPKFRPRLHQQQHRRHLRQEVKCENNTSHLSHGNPVCARQFPGRRQS